MKANGDKKDVPASSSSDDQQLADELADIDLNDPELAQAAAKIQKQFRGFKKAGASKTEAAPPADVKPAEEAKPTEDDELADIDLTDPELEKAAMKIQSTFKGFKSRKTQE